MGYSEVAADDDGEGDQADAEGYVDDAIHDCS